MRLVKQFPHRAAQVLRVDNPKTNPDQLDHFTQQLDMTHLKSKVEELHDSDYCELAIQLVDSNLCGRLHTLDLKLNDLYNAPP
jgi:hypothetical protein